RSVETSMGMTPLEGLVMGTRCGDLDPGVILHLLRSGALDVDGLDRLLNHESGLAGLSGVGNDMRDIERLAGEGSDGPDLGPERSEGVGARAGVAEHDPSPARRREAQPASRTEGPERSEGVGARAGVAE